MVMDTYFMAQLVLKQDKVLGVGDKKGDHDGRASRMRCARKKQPVRGNLAAVVGKYGCCVFLSFTLMGCSPVDGSESSPYADPFIQAQEFDASGQSGQSGQSIKTGEIAKSPRHISKQGVIDPWPKSAPGRDAGPQIRRGSGTVRIGLMPNDGVTRGVDKSLEGLPESLLEEFTRRSGYRAHLSTVPQESGRMSTKQLDIVMGFDRADLAALSQTGEPFDSKGIVPYGRDDVCIAIDRQWFSANKIEAPTSFDFLESGASSQYLEIPDPSTSPVGRSFVLGTKKAKADKVDDWWRDLLGKGARVTDPHEVGESWMVKTDKDLKTPEEKKAQSKRLKTEAKSTRPITVVSASRVSANLTNTDSESRIALVGSTCVHRELYAAALPGIASSDSISEGEDQGNSGGSRGNAGAQAWLAFVQGAMSQRIMAAEGFAWPLMSDSLAESTVMSWFAQPSSHPVTLSDSEWEHAPAALGEWEKVVKSVKQ